MATAEVKRIIVSPGQRACINCQHYAPCWREVEVPGEAWKKGVPVNFGWCSQREEPRGPLYRPCKGYKPETPSLP